MAINALLDIELSVPDPRSLGEFWERHGLRRTDDGVYGTATRPVQLRVTDGDHRHLSRLHLGCESERDIADVATRLEGIGVAATIRDTTLSCIDPVLGHEVVVDVAHNPAITSDTARTMNRPGMHSRLDERAPYGDDGRTPPRRLGHLVLGSPRIADTTAFYIHALGYRVSDQFVGETATFARIESDHHNLLIHKSKVGYLNHYAMEMDDIDAVGRAGTAIVTERPEANVTGIGRHFLGSNVFWYMRDPAGNMFELFCDMDQIVDDEAWAKGPGRRDWGANKEFPAFSVWGPAEPAEFFAQPDLAQIAAAREARGLA